MSEEERYQKVEQERQDALNQSNQTYNDLLAGNTQVAQAQREYTTNWENTQKEIADRNADRQLEIQNQNKEKAEKAYKDEAIASKNAYYDFINPYGANAEIQAQNGLNNTGYSETTKLGAWNINQNRTAKARASMNDAKLQYDNAMKDIELNRDTTKAQYALEALKMQLDATLEEYNNASQLKLNQLNNTQALDSEYNNRYNNVWNQINTEKQQAEQIRQYEQNYALQKQEFDENIRQFDENIAYLKEKDAKEYELQIKKLEEQKRQAQVQEQQWAKEYQLSLQKMYAQQNAAARSYTLTDNNDEYLVAGNSNSSSSSNSNGKTTPFVYGKLSANYSPYLSSKKANSWYETTFGAKQLTKEELAQMITDGLNGKKINQDDANKIKRAYGLS